MASLSIHGELCSCSNPLMALHSWFSFLILPSHLWEGQFSLLTLSSSPERRILFLLYPIYQPFGRILFLPYPINQPFGRILFLPYPIKHPLGGTVFLPYPIKQPTGRTIFLPYPVKHPLGLFYPLFSFLTIPRVLPKPNSSRELQACRQTEQTRPFFPLQLHSRKTKVLFRDTSARRKFPKITPAPRRCSAVAKLLYRGSGCRDPSCPHLPQAFYSSDAHAPAPRCVLRKVWSTPCFYF